MCEPFFCSFRKVYALKDSQGWHFSFKSVDINGHRNQRQVGFCTCVVLTQRLPLPAETKCLVQSLTLAMPEISNNSHPREFYKQVTWYSLQGLYFSVTFSHISGSLFIKQNKNPPWDNHNQVPGMRLHFQHDPLGLHILWIHQVYKAVQSWSSHGFCK